MRYICLIYNDQAAFAKLSENEQQSVRAAHGALGNELRASGQFLDGSELAPARTAATVRVRNGQPQTTDGPFAETREQLGGYFIIEAKDREEAIAIAARIPSAHNGTIEVRSLV